METEKKFEQMNTLEEVIESAEITEDSEEMESEEKETSPIIADEVKTDEELEKYLEEVRNLPFIDLMRTKSKAQKDLESVKSAKELLDAISKMQIEQLTASIMQTNAIMEHGLDYELKEFNDQYDTNVKKLNAIIEAANEKIAEYDETQTSKTSFLSDQMVLSIQNRIDRLNPEALNYDYFTKRYRTIMDAFSNRDDFSFLVKKATSFMNNKATIRAFRKYMKNENQRKKSTKILAKNFSPVLLATVVSKIKEMTNEATASLFIFFLAKVCEQEKRTAKDAYVKALVLTIGDIDRGDYDLSDPEEYLDKLNIELLSLFNLEQINILFY